MSYFYSRRYEYIWYSFFQRLSRSQAIVRPEGLSQKIPFTSSKIEPATFRLVAQFLKQLRRHLLIVQEDGWSLEPSFTVWKEVFCTCWDSKLISPSRDQRVNTKKSHPSIENKLLIYKAVIKPVWSYGIELWGCASKSNTVIMHRSQSKLLRAIAIAPWY